MRRIGSLEEWIRFLEAGSRDDAAATLSGYSRQIDAQYADLGRIVRDLYESPTGEVADVLMMARSALAEAAGMLDSVRARIEDGDRESGMSVAALARGAGVGGGLVGRRGLWRVVRRWPGPVAALVAVGLADAWSPAPGLDGPGGARGRGVAAVGGPGAGVVPPLAARAFSTRGVAGRAASHRGVRVAVACGLGRSRWRGRSRADPASRAIRERLPRLTRVDHGRPRVTLHLRPLVGQTVETFSAAGEQLRMAVGATRVRVDPEGVNRVRGHVHDERLAGASRSLRGPAGSRATLAGRLRADGSV